MQRTSISWPLDVPPRDVQLAALNKGYGKPGFAYLLRQRLGKSWLAYAEFKLLQEDNKVDWMFLICPNSLKDQWAETIREVDEYVPICIYESSAKAKSEYFFKKNKSGGVFIINYESVRTFMEDEGELKFSPQRTYIVADESTKIKDHAAKSTKACLALSSLCAYRRILTGRPTANSNSDLWAQLKFIDATSRNYFSHKLYFCQLGGFQGRQIVRNVNTEYLQKEIEPFSYIAEDKYIEGFKKIYEPMRRIILTPDQQKQYKQMEDELLLELSDGTEITAPIALVKYLRLQQISSGVAGSIDGSQHNTIEPTYNPRIRIVREILDSEISNRVIIPCRFRLSIDNLYDILVKDGYKVAKMVGGMGAEIENEKKRFNEGDATVMLAQLQVLSYGHTLCAGEDNPCTDMIFYESDFSLISRIQAESRPEKLGRNIPISYWDMYASKMDRYILETLRKKEDASMALMGYARSMGFRPDNE